MFGKLDKKSLMVLAAAAVMAIAGCEKPSPDGGDEPEVAAAGIGGSWETCTVNLYPFGSPMPADVNQHAICDRTGGNIQQCSDKNNVATWTT